MLAAEDEFFKAFYEIEIEKGGRIVSVVKGSQVIVFGTPVIKEDGLYELSLLFDTSGEGNYILMLSLGDIKRARNLAALPFLEVPFEGRISTQTEYSQIEISIAEGDLKLTGALRLSKL